MSSAELRPHCDITDIVGLVCLRTAKEGGESTIRSAMTIYNEIFDKHSEYLPALHRGFHFSSTAKARQAIRTRSPTGYRRWLA